MEAELPTKPGAYYWREKDGDEWKLVIVVFDNDPFMEPTVKFVFNDFENDIKAMEGQWLLIPTPQEVMELLWRVHNVLDNPRPIELQHLGEYALKLFKEIGE